MYTVGNQLAMLNLGIDLGVDRMGTGGLNRIYSRCVYRKKYMYYRTTVEV